MESNRKACVGDVGRLGAAIRARMRGVAPWMAAVAIAIAPLPASADDLPGVGSPSPLIPAPSTDFISQWLLMASVTQSEQPHWIAPLVTVTPRLEQQFRVDYFQQIQGNGTNIANFGGGKGLELISSYSTEIILGFPPFEESCPAESPCAHPPRGKDKAAEGWGDWTPFLLKYRFAAENEENGNYIVTGFLQMSVPTGVNNISTDLYILQPTLAFGKGWGDFDIQATLSQQYPVATINPAINTVSSFGDPVLANVTFQYHIFEYLWPEFEVNYEYFPNGLHQHLSQVLLTPGIIFGRFPIPGGTERDNLVVGIGYQMAVTANPITNNNLVVSARVNF